LSLAAVRDLRVARAPVTAEDLAALHFSLGSDARTQADNCIMHCYDRLGDIAKQIATGAAISTDMVKGYAAAFEPAGCDELIFIRATASPGRLELLAGRCCSTLDCPGCTAW